MKKIEDLHPWDVSFKEAVMIQKDLKDKIVLEPFEKHIELIGGADVSYIREQKSFTAVFVILKYPGFEVVERSIYTGKSSFPYIPGLLSFREIPPLIKSYEKLKTLPDVLILDGQGIAHPRFFGLASHVGYYLDLPTIGCAKKKLCGEFKMPDDEVGSVNPLIYKNKVVGSVIRTRRKCKPVFVSPGHLMDVDSANRIIIKCITKYRLPEPTRIAHLLTRSMNIKGKK